MSVRHIISYDGMCGMVSLEKEGTVTPAVLRTLNILKAVLKLLSLKIINEKSTRRK